jgi:hypothetical protein
MAGNAGARRPRRKPRAKCKRVQLCQPAMLKSCDVGVVGVRVLPAVHLSISFFFSLAICLVSCGISLR